MTAQTKLTIDGNPGAARTDRTDWNGATSTVQIDRFIFHAESATEAQLEICVDGFAPGAFTECSAELTYADLLALRDAVNAIIATVIADGRAS